MKTIALAQLDTVTGGATAVSAYNSTSTLDTSALHALKHLGREIGQVSTAQQQSAQSQQTMLLAVMFAARR